MPLLRHRLRWYALSTARLLLRRWQAAVLIIGIGASASATVLDNVKILTHPVLALLAAEHGAVWCGTYLLALLAFSGLWASMQRAQIEGGSFMSFVTSLPFSPRQLRHTNIAVLLLADSPLLLMVGGAMTATLAHHAPASHLLLLCDLLILALATQVAVLERRLDELLTVAVLCFILAAGFGTRFAPAIDLLAGATAILMLWFGPRRRPQHPAPTLPMPVPHSLRQHWQPTLAVPWFAALQVSIAILYRERRHELTGKTLIAVAVIGATWSLVQIFDADQRCLPVILIAQGLLALSISGMFRHLYMSHRASSIYISALPLAPYWWRIADLAVVAAFGLPFLAALSLVACFIGAISAWHAAAAVISYTVLLCVLSVPHLYSERHAVVLSTLVSGLWIAAMLAYLN